jgi:hypothetical protein
MVLLGASVAALAQQPLQATSQDADVMVAAVSRDGCMFCGGIGPGIHMAAGAVTVEPLGYLSQSGEWKALPCGKDWPKTCIRFAREYLNKPHDYTVVSADGQGATIQAAPTRLSESRGYSGQGTCSGGTIVNSAIAASSTDLFAEAAPLRLLGEEEARSIRSALGRRVPQKLGSIRWIRVFSTRLEGLDLFVAQRSYSDIAAYTDARYDFVFTIGTMNQGRFKILYWKKDTEDEKERVLGTIHLKSGRDYLVTTVSDPESQWFRVYGILNGEVALVYSGGGSSC